MLAPTTEENDSESSQEASGNPDPGGKRPGLEHKQYSIQQNRAHNSPNPGAYQRQVFPKQGALNIQSEAVLG